MAPTYSPCEATFFFGDGDHLFRLRLKQLAELEEKCGAGIGTIYRRLATGGWYIADCVETIRLGLVGGGMGAHEAYNLVQRYGEELPKEALWTTAFAVAGACMVGFDDGKGKKKAAPKRRKTTA